ncbi:MAG: CHAT domain-containing protein [Tychonema bourrellyi B0820]|uniref:CHAT domain-containing protein n=1 Tax=Tychonema bourrellyi FEM_GT703 TaxID=2040638 RepID=A0A2G4EXX5_9CYAN|nr:CHAT domain-containing protein [Tychonema bourrellyi]MDQ2096265.1 CHAT domain-containing protein [Tychonema bourrellyi B0820]PHX54328.1 CHAT domain-containing protein [Tychonema bourrellyi FEM_GT703]
MSQEFRLSVTPVGDDEYLVRTEKVAPGVPLAEQQVRWPIDQWLDQSAKLMNDPLMGVFEGKASRVFSRSSRNQAPNLVALGQQLHSGLFQGRLRDSWTCAQGIAQHRREVLQLRLGLKDRRLPRLPWEVLHADDRPLATGTDVVFSRYHTGTSLLKPTRIIPSSGPLRILMALASPSDRDSLQLKREVLHLQQELQNRTVNPLKNNLYAPEIELTILEQPDREQLTQALEQGHYQVLHYAGHSNLGSRGGELYLVSSRTGLTETLSGDDLAGLLVNNGIQMAVFNSCRGAYGDPSDLGEDSPERNLTEALVKRGIPAVLAMAESIPDDVALTLTRLFYRNLKQGYPVDLSLSRARAGLITAYGSHQLYWALPILYQHPEFDGYLTATPTQNATGDSPLPKKSILGMQPLVAGAELKTRNSATVEQEPDSAHLEVKKSVPGVLGTQRYENQQNSPLSTLNSPSQVPTPTPPISTLGSSVITTPITRSAVVIHKPVKKSGLKKSLTVALCLLPVALSAGFFGWRHLQNSNAKPEELLPAVRTPISQGYVQIHPVNLEEAQTAKVMAIALNNFQAGEIWAGLKATEALLDQVALPQAEGALQAVPKYAIDNPEVNFLKGRLAWQFQQVGNKKYSVDDARRSWEMALKARPDSLKYRNALGFAYYAEGNFDRAYQVWTEVLSSIAPQSNQPTSSPSVRVGKHISTATAGLAMVMAKPIPNMTPQQQADRLTKAIQFREQAIASDSLSFEPSSLAKNWLWSKAAIRDWQSVQKLQKVR